MDLEQSMKIYMKLRAENPFSPGDIGRLLQTLHTSVRVTKRDANKHKSQKRNINVDTETIKSYLLVIAEDMKNGVVKSSFWGATHLFTAFATMEVPQEGLDLWTQLSNLNASQCYRIVWSPAVIGSIIDLMIAVDAPFADIESIYLKSKSSGDQSSSNIEQAMIGALIKENKISEALELFENVLRTYPEETYSLVRIHDRFVGDCEYIPTALKFFFDGVEGKTPYKPTTHPSTVVRLMQRIWHNNSDFDLLERVWKSYISSVPPSMGEWMFNATVNFYLRAFMEYYPQPTTEAVARLKDMIQFYIKSRVNITPIFLNTVLSAVQPWADRDIVFTIISAYQIYHLAEDAVSCRIILNSLENIDVEESYIVGRWNKLLEAQMKPSSPVPQLHQFDFLALLRACFKPERELLFTSIFESLLDQGSISDKVIEETRNAITNNPRYSSKIDFFNNLLSKHFIEFDQFGKVFRNVPFS